MDRITPSYYASGTTVGRFELTGRFFDRLPDDAIGVMALSNNNPLQFRYSVEATQTFKIDAKTSKTLEMSQITASAHDKSVYLGAILSADHEIIYWINNTNPLP